MKSFLSSTLRRLYDDGLRNRSKLDPPYSIPPVASQLHERLLVADMHADSLMMDRGDPDGILNRNRRGHIDVPRLQDGNVGIQMLNVVTRAPLVFKEPFGPDRDAMRIITRGQSWPKETWRSERARAFHKAEKWNRLIRDERIVGIRRKDDLKEFLSGSYDGSSPQTWSRKDNVAHRTAVLLGLEGVHAFEHLTNSSSQSDVDAEVGAFLASGFRLFGVSHYFDNRSASSSQGKAVGAGEDGGLTDLGKRVAHALIRNGVILDLAHASPRSIDDLLNLTGDPVIYSHGGIRAHTDNNRNLETRHAVEIAKRGGVICIGYWKEAVGDISVQSIVSAMEKTAEILSEYPEIEDPWNHVGIGSDFDGAVNTLFNCDGHGLLTAGLIDRGHPEHVIRRIMGGNVAGFLLKALPDT